MGTISIQVSDENEEYFQHLVDESDRTEAEIFSDLLTDHFHFNDGTWIPIPKPFVELVKLHKGDMPTEEALGEFINKAMTDYAIQITK